MGEYPRRICSALVAPLKALLVPIRTPAPFVVSAFVLASGTVKRAWPVLVLVALDVGDIYEKVHTLLPDRDWVPERLDMPEWLLPWILWGAIAWGVSVTFHDLRTKRTGTQTATENSAITYNHSYIDNSVTNIYHDAPLARIWRIVSARARETFIRFRLEGGIEILDSSNITSITDRGVGEFDILFTRALNPATLVVRAIGSAPSNFQVKDATADSVSIMFEDGEPDMIALRFDD